MLRITDTRTGRVVEIPSAHRHLLRICVHLPAIDTGIGMAHLRAPLVGDVLARAAELHGLQALTALTTPDLPHDQTQALDRAMAALGIHPPATIGVPQLTETICAAADVHILAYDAVLPDAADGARIEVGQVSPPPPDGFAPAGTDPLAVRMLLLGHAYGVPVMATGSVLAEARRTLTHWRQQVAEWAQQPSRPIPADELRQARAVLADDLGVPALLDMLADVATRADVPAGAKFETFAFLDRVLGLDLVREVGHQHQATP
ncbi:hypothetical protein ACE1OC_37215 [Streptomyces sp. DSM 116496]|uniref:hypothetical protein n=1 Tax=Streptomyces stoeckheimensis TaxID=3344656 RepID=UPI0038B2B798